MKVGYFLLARRLPGDPGCCCRCSAEAAGRLEPATPALRKHLHSCGNHTRAPSERRKSPARRSHLKQFSVFIHCYPSQWAVRMLDPGQGLCLAGASFSLLLSLVSGLKMRRAGSPWRLGPLCLLGSYAAPRRKTSLHAARDNNRARIRSPCDLSTPSESISSGF